MNTGNIAVCSSRPTTKDPVYVVPLRVGKQKGPADSAEGKARKPGKEREGREEKSEEELQLEREAAAAVLKGTGDSDMLQACMQLQDKGGVHQ